MKKNNKGFSLVELLTVIAILGVASSLIAGSFFKLSGSYAKRGVESTEVLLSRVKLDALSKHECYLELSYDEESDQYTVDLYRDVENDGNYTLYQSEKIGDNKLTVAAGNASNTVDGDNPIVIAFNRRTASLKTATIGDTDLKSGSTLVKLFFSSGNTTKTLSIYPATGFIEVS